MLNMRAYLLMYIQRTLIISR